MPNNLIGSPRNGHQILFMIMLQQSGAENEKDDGALPHYLWGLDCVFHARVKLNICDVIKLEEYPNYAGGIIY